MELSARLKALARQRGYDEVKLRAAFDIGLTEETLYAMLSDSDPGVAAKEFRQHLKHTTSTKDDGLVTRYKVVEPAPKPAFDVQGMLRRVKEKQLDKALTAAEVALEDRYEELLEADAAQAEQLVVDLVAWVKAWKPGQAAAPAAEPATPPVVTTKEAPKPHMLEELSAWLVQGGRIRY